MTREQGVARRAIQARKECNAIFKSTEIFRKKKKQTVNQEEYFIWQSTPSQQRRDEDFPSKTNAEGIHHH